MYKDGTVRGVALKFAWPSIVKVLVSSIEYQEEFFDE